ncbi:MAG: ATP-binding protein [Acidobacteriota bacterium]
MTALFQGFRSLVENSPDAISLIDSEGYILYGSGAANELFGYCPDDLVGRKYLDLVHPDDRDHSSRVLRDVLDRPTKPVQWETRILHQYRPCSWVESSASNLLLDDDVKAILVQTREINARKLAEIELQERVEELIRCNSRWEEFAHTAAHDLKEPVRTISLFTELLVRRTQMNPPAEQMAKLIVDSAARMMTLIDGLLSFASTGTHEPLCRVNLEDVLPQVMENLAVSLAESDAKVSLDRLPSVTGNYTQFLRIFQNLISNAVKYRRADSVEIHIAADRQDRDWVLRVKDNGVGVAEDNKGRIFKPFLRLAGRETPGNGLGLALCKKLVESWGGAIWVESELGIGSTFCFTIPVAVEEAQGSAQHHCVFQSTPSYPICSGGLS